MNNWQNSFDHWAVPFGMQSMPAWVFPLLILLVLWSIVWKGMALWKAARRSEQTWFIVLLVVNTFGILDILYLYLFSKDIKQLTDGSDRPMTV